MKDRRDFNLLPIDRALVGMARDEKYPIFFVDNFASSGSTLYTALHSSVLGDNVFGFISSCAQDMSRLPGVKTLFYDPDTGLGIFTRSE
jgi:hypothetical protein